MTWLAKTVFLGVIGTGVIGGMMYWQFQEPVLEETQRILVDLPLGSGVRTVARSLGEQGIAHRWQTRLAGWWYLRRGETLKAGRYTLQGPMSWGQLFAKLTKGEAESMTVTFVEGKRWADFKEQLKKSEYLIDTEWLDQPEGVIASILRDKQRDWVCPPDVLEGCLMPDTYALYSGMPVQEVLSKAYSHFDSTVRAIWQDRDANLPVKSPYEMVVLASIVEKETGHDADRGRIARVFMNRLKKGMRLQSDPTVIYGVRNFDGNLTREHLRTDHSYNTYTRMGLTPTPIAAVGRAALEAVAHPTPGRWLYFVARADGTTAFSENLTDHNDAVWRYQVAPAQAKNTDLPRVHH